MASAPLFERLEPWIEGYLGAPLSALGLSPVPVAVRAGAHDGAPLTAIRLGERAAVVMNDPEWPAKLRPVVGRMHPDMLFSAFGCYELTRALSEEGIAVWGPNWHLFGDEAAVMSATQPVADTVKAVSPAELAQVDFDLFWHCRLSSVAAFGVHEDGELAALATVVDRGEPVLEIGMEVAPGAKGRGLGRAVVCRGGAVDCGERPRGFGHGRRVQRAVGAYAQVRRPRLPVHGPGGQARARQRPPRRPSERPIPAQGSTTTIQGGP